MSKDAARIDRLERALEKGLSIDLHEFDDEEQAEAYEKELAKQEKQAEKVSQDAADAAEKAEKKLAAAEKKAAAAG